MTVTPAVLQSFLGVADTAVILSPVQFAVYQAGTTWTISARNARVAIYGKAETGPLSTITLS